MAAKRLAYLKRFLAWLGARLPIAAIYQCEAVINHLKLGRWLKDQGFRFPKVYASRREVFADVGARVRDRHVLYLEFGVFEGASMRIWSEQLKHPGAHLHGFDSFEGLPENYISIQPQGTFTTSGAIPQIDDPRVKFFKGWFDQTLPTYDIPPHEVLVLNLDADLYSSTIYVLRHLRPWIRRGTLVYLDDMAVPDHEGRAFAEFMLETGLQFAPLCADRALCCQFYECLGARDEVA